MEISAPNASGLSKNIRQKDGNLTGAIVNGLPGAVVGIKEERGVLQVRVLEFS
jgi:hypothetical protein